MGSKEINKRVSYTYLLKTFFVIGATSFGGYSALVAMVQNIMVNRDKTIDNDAIIKGFSMASMLPGPVAVNTVTYIGYVLAGWLGAFTSMFAVVLPSMILMIFFSFLYQEYNSMPGITNFLIGVIPVVMGVIITAAYNMSKKSLISYKHYVILVIVLLLQVIFTGFWVYILIFFLGAVLGYYFFKEGEFVSPLPKKTDLKGHHILIIIFLAITLLINFISIPAQYINLNLATVFTGISLTLFGGGYVMIPMLNDIIVNQREWLTNSVFMDAISLGQITPGPILISATFIGYKMNGVIGAIIATVSIFLPSGLLMILVSDIFNRAKENRTWEAIFQGIKPVVVALIISSVVVLAKSIEHWWISGVIFIISSILLIKYKINFLWLVIVAGLLGVFIF